MSRSNIEGDLYVGGSVYAAGGVNLGAGVVADANVVAGADIDAAKLNHLHTERYAQPNTTATTETRVLHVAKGAGTVVAFSAGSIVANLTTATVTVDLKKNGTTVLSGVITLDNANVAYTPEAGTISVAPYVAGDVFTVVITATASGGTLATGAYCSASFDEAYS
jgi:hypothetical protein